ncbi:hypothetical protein NP233_g7067 [Leucocoprinus birnbaumii]|uniref:DUF6534 domain-containing protein n=1 Tax=Leucocoprinus birnbaumii TaxID=56174 RepID=A0AAD5VSA4_9AGAR|nr:hypothetical protein NP233_g7067 [Leucocoprinus birnbaumii]
MAPTTALISLESTTLDNTVGALFLGVLGAVFLFGITTLQTFWYYHLYPKDSLLHKCSVAVLWTLDTLHLALTIQAVYTYLVTGFGDRIAIDHILWSIKSLCDASVDTCLMVAVFWLTVGEYHRGIVKYLVAFVLLGGFAIGVVLAYHVYHVHTYTELENVSWVIVAAFATSTGIDFVITAAMCYYLWKSQVPTSRLNSRILTVIQYSLGSGLFTSACSLSALFTYVLLPNTLVFLGLEFLLTKLYILSFLTMLNARKRTVTTNHPSTTGILTSEATQAGTPVTDLPRRLRNKFHQCTFSIGSNTSSQTQTQAHIRVHRVIRPVTSSFWSPPPPASDEGGYTDYVPADLDLESTRREGGGGPEGCERSLSDDSETISGTYKGPLSPVSPTSAESLLRSPVQRPASVYDGGEAQMTRASADIRLSNTSYPWHAR